MWMIPKDSTHVMQLRYWLHEALEQSRFTASSEEAQYRGKWGVKFECVRLRYKKDYCGAHPGPCLNNNRKHMKARFLEGMDWVGFNAMINDMLDKRNVDCDVFSFNREGDVYGGRYFIRRGRCRRILYPYRTFDRFALWTQVRASYETDFADYCGKNPPALDTATEYSGTPGVPCYDVESEIEWRKDCGDIEDAERIREAHARYQRLHPVAESVLLRQVSRTREGASW